VSPAVTASFSWNLGADLSQMLSYEFMRNAFAAGAVVAVAGGMVGYFVILRRSAFAAHALSHVGFSGAAGAALVGVDPLWGLLVFCLAAGGVMGGLGHRLNDRDTVIGIVLAESLALGVLFISLYSGYETEAYSILFGEILGISTTQVTLTIVIGAVTLALLGFMYRPLLFASTSPDVAEARGVPVRLLSVAFMMTVALSVAIAVEMVGVLLVFALVVAPAAAAERLARRPGRALVLAALIALLATWLGLAIAYYLPYPVSFFITSLTFLFYVAVRAGTALAGRASRTRTAAAVAVAVAGDGAHAEAPQADSGLATTR
jgi:zinc/manganese transport system permease protein